MAGPLGLRQRADRLQAAEKHRDVGVVLVGGIVQIDHLRLAARKDLPQVGRHLGVVRPFHCGARMGQLDLDAVVAQPGGPPLLAAPDGLHLGIAHPRIASGARAAAAVGRDNAGKPAVVPSAAQGNAMKRHDLDVILVGADAQMRGAGQRRGRRQTRRHVDVGLGLAEFHEGRHQLWPQSAPGQPRDGVLHSPQNFPQLCRGRQQRRPSSLLVKPIIALLDFSAVTDRVFETAADLAAALHCGVVLLHVVQASKVSAAGITSIDVLQDAVTAKEQQAARQLERYEKRMQLDHGSVSKLLLRGVPAPQIVAYAEKTGAAFLVMGSHGEGAIAGRLVGGTIEAVLRRTVCPVIVVPHPELGLGHADAV